MVWGQSANKTYLCSWVRGQSGIRQDEGVGIIHQRTDADKVDYSDFIVVLEDGEHGRSVSVWALDCMIWMSSRMILMTVNKSGTKASPRSDLKGTRVVVGWARVAHAYSTRNRALTIPQGH